MPIIDLTLNQVIQTGDLPASIQCVERPDSLRKVDIVRQGPCELHQQSVQGPEAVVGHGVHQPFEIFVSIAVEAHFPGPFLRREGLESARAVEAAMRTVRRAGDQTVAFGARLGPGQRVGPGCPVRLLSLLKVLKLDTSAQRHAVCCFLFRLELLSRES